MIEGNDERLAMIRQAPETEGGRRVTAGPRLTGADNPGGVRTPV